MRILIWILDLNVDVGSVPVGGAGSVPASGAGSVPAGGAGSVPAGGAGSVPAGGVGSVPAGGAGSVPVCIRSMPGCVDRSGVLIYARCVDRCPNAVIYPVRRCAPVALIGDGAAICVGQRESTHTNANDETVNAKPKQNQRRPTQTNANDARTNANQRKTDTLFPKI